MKNYFIAFLLITCTNLFAQQQYKLEKIWETDTTLAVPESVLPLNKKQLLVSNIDGGSATKDGKGSISIINHKGLITQKEFITTLNAPKGMALWKDTLYIADVDEVVVVDMKRKTIVQKIKIEKAIFLNDVTVDNKGTIYVSDSRDKKVYSLKNRVPELYLDNLQSPNGLLWHNNFLYVLDAGSLLKFNTEKIPVTITTGMERSTDGIVLFKDGFIVSCWVGTVYIVDGQGNKQKVLDTQEQKSNTADIAFDAKRNILYIPTFSKNNVVAYKILAL